MILDFDDFSEKNNRLDLLFQLKANIPNLKVTLFTVPGKCSLRFLKEVNKFDWIELALHGAHHTPLECKDWTKERGLEYLKRCEAWGCFVKVFRPPFWADSPGLKEALSERGYVFCQNKPTDYQGRTYLLNDQSVHGHIQNVCGNGLEEHFEFYKNLKGSFKFISELFCEEFFAPLKTGIPEIVVNVERYLYALEHCKDKTVLVVACGSGLGTYLYSLVAKKIIAVDYNQRALDHTKRYPFKCKVEFLFKDIEKEFLPEADICVSLETIEHLENPDFFLKNLKCKELFFSIPVPSLKISTWHKQDFKTPEEVKSFIDKYFKVIKFDVQREHYCYGKATKKD